MRAESLFSRHEAELLEDGVFGDVSQARNETFSHIEGDYNRVRRHSALDYKTFGKFEWESSINTKKKDQMASGLCLVQLDYLNCSRC